MTLVIAVGIGIGVDAGRRRRRHAGRRDGRARRCTRSPWPGSVWRSAASSSTSLAGEVVAAIVILTFVIDLVAPALKRPDWVHQLALTAHLGQPMIGNWDWVGMAGLRRDRRRWPAARVAGASRGATSSADLRPRRDGR